MGEMSQKMKNWSLATKLSLLFGLFGLMPIIGLGWMAWQGAQKMESKVGEQFQTTAVTIADKIDRSLFERYGDVQAFALNEVVKNEEYWYNATDGNKLVPTLDQYISTYGIYYLTLLVDTQGELMAVNQHDMQGKPINYRFLFEKDYSQTPWFQALSKGEYSTKMPHTSEENTISSGTYIEDLHIDEDVKLAYPGDPGMTMGFSAPIYGAGGEVIGYWSNRAMFSLVEEIVGSTYGELKAQGFPGAEITLLDGEGNVIVDYDPATSGKEAPSRNFEDILFKLNLADKGVKAAQEAVAGKTGNIISRHARKGIVQAGGYAHLKGSLGYPGMNWAVLVRIPQAEASASSRDLMNNVWMMALGCLVLIIPMGLWIGRKGAGQVRVIQEAAAKMASGDYAARVVVSSGDEIGQLGDSFNHMAEEIQTKDAEKSEREQQMQESTEREKEQQQKLEEGVAHIAEIGTNLASASEELTSVSSTMGSTAEETSSQANVVAAAAEQVSKNVQSVSTGSEEMTASIQEIAKNTTDAARVAAQAVTVAESTTTTVGKLGQSSAEIGSIIKVITTIAEQTNLLALNATIEAARAGDAGKGFAVVANEVKELAKETTKATENISRMIETIQEDTKGSVDAIEEISTIIKQVNDYMNTIASAVEEQTVTTNEMARNVTEASKGSMEIAGNIVSVADAARGTTEGATQTQQASSELSRMAQDLQRVVSSLT